MSCDTGCSETPGKSAGSHPPRKIGSPVRNLVIKSHGVYNMEGINATAPRVRSLLMTNWDYISTIFLPFMIDILWYLTNRGNYSLGRAKADQPLCRVAIEVNSPLATRCHHDGLLGASSSAGTAAPRSILITSVGVVAAGRVHRIIAHRTMDCMKPIPPSRFDASA